MPQISRSRQPAARVRHLRVGAEADGQRLDNYLIRQWPGVPKSHVYRLLRSGQVRVDGARAKADRRLAEGQVVRLPPVRQADRPTVRPPDAVLARLREAVIYEDAAYLAIDKPVGLAAHGGSGLAFGVIEAARAWERHGFLELCHRLDRDTSGVLLLAKTRPALLRAQAAFRRSLARKRYLALLCGVWRGDARVVDAALVANRLAAGERMVAVDEDLGKAARSRFTPQERYPNATLCDVAIDSGRTHQIRVHAAALGHPVAGDRKYGTREQQAPMRARGLRRMFLHAHLLELPPAENFPMLTLSVPLPDELRDFLQCLRVEATPAVAGRRVPRSAGRTAPDTGRLGSGAKNSASPRARRPRKPARPRSG